MALMLPSITLLLLNSMFLCEPHVTARPQVGTEYVLAFGVQETVLLRHTVGKFCACPLGEMTN